MSGHFRKDLSTAVAYILGHLRNYLFTLSSGGGGGGETSFCCPVVGTSNFLQGGGGGVDVFWR